MITLKEAIAVFQKDVESFEERWEKGVKEDPKNWPTEFESMNDWLDQFLTHMTFPSEDGDTVGDGGFLAVVDGKAAKVSNSQMRERLRKIREITSSNLSLWEINVKKSTVLSAKTAVDVLQEILEV